MFCRTGHMATFFNRVTSVVNGECRFFFIFLFFIYLWSIASTKTKYIKLNTKTQNMFCHLNESLQNQFPNQDITQNSIIISSTSPLNNSYNRGYWSSWKYIYKPTNYKIPKKLKNHWFGRTHNLRIELKTEFQDYLCLLTIYSSIKHEELMTSIAII